MARFDSAIELVLRHEGGYVNDQADPGGETKYGISRRSYPDLDIRNLTRTQAVEIYHRDFWMPHGYGDFASDGLAAKVMDIAVNVGAARANSWLQDAVNDLGGNLKVDGELGPLSLSQIGRVDQVLLMVRFLMRAYRHYRKLGYVRPRFARAWMTRLWGV
jgi:lysozyme family protein